jgi:hypothetical protein
MKRNPILVLGLGVLLSFGVFAVGCGDDTAKKNDSSVDAKRDTGSTGDLATATGGAKGTGGVTGAGGAIDSGGAGGVVGSGGAIGSGGATGAGGTTGDGGLGPDSARDVAPTDTAKPDAAADHPVNNSPDVGTVQLDTHAVDVGVDSTPVMLDASLDQSLDAPALDTASIEVQIDSGVDGEIDAG